MLQDLRHSLRMMRHSKGWTAVVVVCLALGIGANAAIFGAVNGLIIEKVPVDDPDGLVRLRTVGRNQMATNTSGYGYLAPINGQEVRASFSYAMFKQFQADNRTMSDLFACAPIGRLNVVVDGVADMATGFISSGNYYRVLGVEARLGRTIVPEDDDPSAEPVAVISERFWRSRFGGDAQVIGKVVHMNGVAVTIVGVLPASFTGVQTAIAEAPDVSLPLSLDPQVTTTAPPPMLRDSMASPAARAALASRLAQPTSWWLQVMGRLNPGATAGQVEGNLGGVFQSTARAGMDAFLADLTPQARGMARNQNLTDVPRLIVESGARGVYDLNNADRRMVSMLGAVVGLVLLIVCANVATLLLSRATARQKELSVRRALGATRTRLVRQLLSESLMLALMGGALGVVVAYWGQQLLPGRVGQVASIDARLIVFLLALTTVTGVLFGVVPALRASRQINEGLKEGGRSVVASRSILSKGLLVLQVAVSLVLLIGAGLFLRTVQHLGRVDVGFNPQNIVLFRVSPQLSRYEPTRITPFYDDLTARVAAIPGVRAVGLSSVALLAGSVNVTGLFVADRTYAPGQSEEIHRVVVSPGFFEALQLPLLLGRSFDARDVDGAPRVALINRTAAAKLYGDEHPVGKRFGTSQENRHEVEVVGIVGDAKYDNVRDAAPPTVFVPYGQAGVPAAVFEVRTDRDPMSVVPAIREAVRQIDPNMPVTNVSTQAEQVSLRYQQEQLFARAYALFGGLAVLIASVGLFGLMSYSVARRTNEIGIRMALGAQPGGVLRLVMRESMILVVAGAVLGIGGALAAGRFVASQLYGVTALDPISFVGATIALLLVGAAAAAIPARRAARVDPLIALRTE